MAKKKKIRNIAINDDTIFYRNKEDFLSTEVDGEAVMMNVSDGTYWGLNETSTDIWNILEKPMKLSGVVENYLKSMK